MVHIKHSSHNCHWSIYLTMVLGHVPKCRRNKVSDQHVTAFVMLASATSHLPALCFIKGSEEVESSGPNTANQTCDWLQHCGWEVMNCPVYSPDRMRRITYKLIPFCSLVFIVFYCFLQSCFYCILFSLLSCCTVYFLTGWKILSVE